MLTIHTMDFLIKPKQLLSFFSYETCKEFHFDNFSTGDMEVFKLLLKNYFIEVCFHKESKGVIYASLNRNISFSNELSVYVDFIDDIKLFSFSVDDLQQFCGLHNLELSTEHDLSYRIKSSGVQFVYEDFSCLHEVYFKSLR